ncbi:MAG: DNA-processing protein DprA [Candidatus Competibacter sp.]|nr:DNA-processing protein DprA [Candidatus Competibacter sp.]MDG4584712.1 DNA-processing protein DprA [Candidatus Competibacter sp.]
MDLHAQTQAVLLLTAYLSKPAKGEPGPLTPMEWGRFARWLKERGIAPEMLLRNDPARLLAGWTDRTVTLQRVQALLNRAGALGLAVEKWQRAGLWILIRADADYPNRLKKHLQADSPPVLFGCGNRRLLDRGGIAVVGSRHAGPEDLAFTTRLGAEAALQGLSVISGGARGVDETAMLGALAREGTAVGVLADSLLRAAISARFRPSLLNGNLALISPFNPEAGFEVGNAMARNKYIYCLADAAIVIAADREQGGTWSGAVENLKHGWTPLWVKPHPDPVSGNAELIRQGGRELPAESGDLTALCVREATLAVDHLSPVVAKPAPPAPKSPRTSTPAADAMLDNLDFYQLFLRRLRTLTAKMPATDQELLTGLDIGKPQLRDWLKRAMEEGQVTKLGKPVRYQWRSARPAQNSFFANDVEG